MKDLDPVFLMETFSTPADIATHGSTSESGNRTSLPENLKALDDISWNFYWSWQPDGDKLFSNMDQELWVRSEQNPRRFLNDVKEIRLWQKSADTAFVEQLQEFTSAFQEYTSTISRTIGQLRPESPVAYFCAEYGIHSSLPIYSGGLGILAGDHLKSASDLNIPLVAIGLFYRYGYFRQKIGHDGWQNEHYHDIFESDTAARLVVDSDGQTVKVVVHIRSRAVFAQAWLVKVGRISLYLLDTNVPENDFVDRLITGHLYGGDSETRIVQEKVLGIGGVRLLRSLGIEPSVYHLNEGHSAFLTLELAREFLASNESASFADAVEAVRTKCVFTTHTPVAAGNDVFSPDDITNCFDAGFIESLRLDRNEFIALGRSIPTDETEEFGMTPLAIRMCRSSNGVSEKHGDVSRSLWLKMFPESENTSGVPITHVTNGVHASTWVSPVFQDLYCRRIGNDWAKLLQDPALWEAAFKKLSDDEIWKAHCTLKNLLVAFVRERTKVYDTGEKTTINEHMSTGSLLSPEALTIGFARRVASYKRWNLLLTDIDRLLKLVDDKERPVQFIFAGKAHPQDRTAKTVLQDLMSINSDSDWQKRAVFIEDYDKEIARYLVRGVDVWMNVPRRPMEASGTSGMKAAMNGALNFSVLDGWWIEGFNGENGFTIGDETGSGDDSNDDQLDAKAMYLTLENEIIPAFYERDDSGLPRDWIRRMRNSMLTLTPQFSSDRMLLDYIEKVYNAND